MTKEFNLSELWEAFKSINENTDIQGKPTIDWINGGKFFSSQP